MSAISSPSAWRRSGGRSGGQVTVTHKGTLHVCGRSLHEERGWTNDGKAHRRSRTSKSGNRLAPKAVDLPFSAALM